MVCNWHEYIPVLFFMKQTWTYILSFHQKQTNRLVYHIAASQTIAKHLTNETTNIPWHQLASIYFDCMLTNLKLYSKIFNENKTNHTYNTSNCISWALFSVECLTTFPLDFHIDRISSALLLSLGNTAHKASITSCPLFTMAKKSFLDTPMSRDELACVYSALILADDDLPITEDKINTILTAAEVEVESIWPQLFARALQVI